VARSLGSIPGKAEDLDPVVGGDLGELLGAGRGGADRPDERLEARRRRGHERAGAAVAVAQRVRHAPGRDHRVSGAQHVDLVADPQRELALEHVEGLVAVAMDVERRLVAGRADHLDQGEGAAGLRAASPTWSSSSSARAAPVPTTSCG
jgi:hypothetical protein